MTKAVILGTGPSLSEVSSILPDFRGLVFGCNNTFEDFRLDCHLACDPDWHKLFSPVQGDFDKWHWDHSICALYGYQYIEGVWMVDGVAYPRSEYRTPPGPCGGLWLEDKTRISLNHCSGAQLLNLAATVYECDPIILLGHDFHYTGKRHYFDGLSDVAGEYPQSLRKYSEFVKPNDDDSLMWVYKRIAEQEGLPRIVNCSPGSKLPWFEMGDFRDFL